MIDGELANDGLIGMSQPGAAGALLSEPMGSSGFWRGSFGGGWEGSMRTPARFSVRSCQSNQRTFRLVGVPLLPPRNSWIR